MKLNNWCFVMEQDLYKAPELLGSQVVGEIEGHPTHPDGKRVQTSNVVHIDHDHKFVETYSGSKYQLGTVKPDYHEWVKDNRPDLLDLCE